MNLWKIAASNVSQRQRPPFATAWNPDIARHGNRLAYSMWNLDTNLWLVEATIPGGKPTVPMMVFSSSSAEDHPAYSPNGRQIAFTSCRAVSWEIWVVNNDGSNPKPLIPFAGPGSISPRWSPDGEWIAFQTDFPGNSDINVMRKDGSEIKLLTTGSSND